MGVVLVVWNYSYKAKLPKGDTYVLCPPGGSLFASKSFFVASFCQCPPIHSASPLLTVNDEVLYTLKGFKENVKARLWQRFTSCEIGNDVSLSVHAGLRHSHHLCVCIDILLAQL